MMKDGSEVLGVKRGLDLSLTVSETLKTLRTITSNTFVWIGRLQVGS